MASVRKSSDEKSQALRAAGALNPHAAAVTDAALLRYPFFNPSDLVQVKYEMVRRVEVGGQSVTETARAFGFSRAAFYTARAALARGGLPALIRQRPGPRRRYKLRPEILTALQQARTEDPMRLSRDLAEWIAARFGVRVHRRTIERVLGPRPKRGTPR